MSARRSFILASLVVGALAAPATAGAATIIGSPDLADTPIVKCGNDVNECSLTQLDGPADADITAPANGVITEIKLKHAAYSNVTIPAVSFQVLGGISPSFTLKRRTTGVMQISRDARIEVVTFPDAGMPIAAGERLGVYATTGELAFEVADPEWTSGSIDGPPGAVGSQSTYQAADGYRVLMQARVEPDADGDGYGDETQDGCPGNGAYTGACPSPEPEPQPQPQPQPQPRPEPRPEPRPQPVPPQPAPIDVELEDALVLPLPTRAFRGIFTSGVLVAVLCPDECRSMSKLYLRLRGRWVLVGSGRAVLDEGEGKVRIRLTRRGRKIMRKVRRGRVEVRTAVRDNNGQVTKNKQGFDLTRRGGAPKPAPTPPKSTGGGGAGLVGTWDGVSHLSTIEIKANGTYTSANGGSGTWRRSGENVKFTGDLSFCSGNATFKNELIEFSCKLEGWPIYFTYKKRT